MALCVSMSNRSEHTHVLISCNVLITEWFDKTGLGKRKLLGVAALIGKHVF